MSDHDRYRRKVCVVCLRKATRDKPLSPRDIELIKKFAREEFNIADPNYLSGLCSSCSISLFKKEKLSDTVVKVEPFTPARGTQLRSTTCDCVICQVGKTGLFAAKKLKKKAGRPSATANKTHSPSPFSSVPFGTSPSSPASRPMSLASLSLSSPSTITICKVCFSEIYQGCRHTCISTRKSRKRKIDNLSRLISSPETSEKLVERFARRGKTFLEYLLRTPRKLEKKHEPQRQKNKRLMPLFTCCHGIKESSCAEG